MTSVELVAEALLPTGSGQFVARPTVLLMAPSMSRSCAVNSTKSTRCWCAVHSECLTGDVFGSLRCDCGPQLEQALEIVAARGGRDHRVSPRSRRARYRYWPETGGRIACKNTVPTPVDANTALGLPVDDRAYDVAAAILFDLHVKRVLLLTNNPAKQRGLEAAGIEVIERVPLVVASNPLNARYLRTKRDRLGHVLDELD
jgi:3,4-dihydroxy 2-butanone 4-phosphate synthase/GTP cyclohydrolase II